MWMQFTEAQKIIAAGEEITRKNLPQIIQRLNG